jgi:hypothetical protein
MKPQGWSLFIEEKCDGTRDDRSDEEEKRNLK